jgi:hypothetical protein
MKKTNAYAGIAACVALSILVVDEFTQTRAGFPPPRPGSAPAEVPDAGQYHRRPIAATYAERKRLYMDWATQQPTGANRSGIFVDLLKLERGTIAKPSDAALRAALDFVNAREDPSDFTMAGLVRLYYLHHADGKLAPEQAEGIRRALLDYKYELDEPGQSMTEMWTENHQILSHSSEYLAGRMFPGAVFTNDGKTGREHAAKARARLLRWIDYHARTGMAEWDSVPYYNMDLSALLNLVEFAGEAEIRSRATMMVDLLVFDVAVDSFYGQFGTSHGRATASTVRSAAGDSLVTFQTLLFGRGRLQTIDMASTMLVTGRVYSLPPVLEAIGLDTPEETINFERDSIPLTAEAAARFGLSLSNVRDFESWWGMGAFSNPETINLTCDAVKQYDLWHYPDLQGKQKLAEYLRPLGLLPVVSRVFNPDSNGVLLSEVNKVSFRTPDVMLSTAQDYRRGEHGYQQHIWQATLGPYAVVFVTNPGAPDLESRPSYWASNYELPRNAQYRNILISIYDIGRHHLPGGAAAHHYGFTHAWFPKWAFNEMRERPGAGGGAWIFGRAGDGYVGLYSRLPYRWTTEGPDAGAEAAAPGLRNVWICQVGRKATDVSFDAFVKKISESKVEVNGTDVVYHAAGTGELKLGWSGPFLVDGKPVALHGYPRWANAYTRSEFGSRQFHIDRAGRYLNLDFEKATRVVH